MREKTFEREVPDGYEQMFHLNAKSLKVGVIFNLIAFVVLAAVLAVAVIPLFFMDDLIDRISVIDSNYFIVITVFFAAMIGYIILHELVHGVAYKALTREKLTFGLSWSCAFCGVPNIFTYRKVAIISAAAPLLLFSILLLPLVILLYFVNPIYYFLGAVVFGMHLGGCAGDFYLVCLLLFKYKDKGTLVKDTGPEQFIYLPVKYQAL